MAADGNESYVLGIDLGTTTVKVALVDIHTKHVIQTKSRETHASVVSEIGSAGNEQDVGKILTALQFCVSGLPKESLTRVVKIGVSGQMHGVMLWKSGRAWNRNSFGRLEVDVASQLFTWQDGRCKGEFLESIPQPRSHIKLATGHGCVTLLWLQRHQPAFVEGYDCAGTVQDFVVAVLCGLDKPIMSVQNAASWGYFDTIDKTWNVDILSEVEFPIHLLPPVHDPGIVAGHTGACWYGIPEGTPVSVAIGDLQCSTLARLQQPEDAVLNISTSAQLAIRMNPNFVPPKMDTTSSIEYFPYFSGHYLAVAASLTGGNVMFAFVKMLQQWTHELGLGVPKTKIWEVLQNVGQDYGTTDLNILPTIFGERHNPSQKAAVTNITPLNTNLGSVYHALCRGIITNLHNMMSQNFLLAAGVKRIVGSGTAVIKNSILSTEIESLYKLPLVLSEGSDADAAVGAALALLL